MLAALVPFATILAPLAFGLAPTAVIIFVAIRETRFFFGCLGHRTRTPKSHRHDSLPGIPRWQGLVPIENWVSISHARIVLDWMRCAHPPKVR